MNTQNPKFYYDNSSQIKKDCLCVKDKKLFDMLEHINPFAGRPIVCPIRQNDENAQIIYKKLLEKV